MGVVSRKVVPVCGNLCFFCPSMRARSRQPVKRYKKILADIFPKSQDAEPNDRKNAKLCEYASKNPLRIPKITNYLEQRFYKDLRNGNLGSVNVVLCIYRKLLSSCKEQMPLFASSLLGVMRTLLEQTQAELQVLGCNTLVDFINTQKDSTYMFNLEGLIPKLCQMAQEVGDDERALQLRSAGLQALASMVWFMGEHSHISMDFDNIISVTLENYTVLSVNPENFKLGRQYSQTPDQSVQGVPKEVDNGKKVSVINLKPELDPKEDASKSPSYWSMVCLYNMAQLAKEATTTRRLLEPLFHSFDTENHWSSEKGLACSVLTYMQLLLEESGLSSHLLLSILVKHLDHKNVVKQPKLQIDIVNTTTQLAQNASKEGSVAIISALSDLIKHLRKCMQYSADASSPQDDSNEWNTNLQSAIERCILQLSEKVGDSGPILDMMAVVLENIPTSAVAARTTLAVVHKTAQIISPIPNVSYYKKAFPDALFHQLLLAMVHTDHETRVLAHHVFSTVLLPSLICPWSNQSVKTSLAVHSRKLKSGSFLSEDENKEKLEHLGGGLREEVTGGVKHSLRNPSRGQSFSSNLTTNGKVELISLRLSSHQVSLLLSSIWVQATSTENSPANFEAMAHTYNVALLFTRAKTSSHLALVRCFQLAFSLRSISMDQEGGLQPSRRRSLFTMASYMLIFAARASNLPDLIPIVKSSLTDETVDPFLKSIEDIRLQTCIQPAGEVNGYGTQEDEVAASKSLSAIKLDDQMLKETVVSHFMSKYGKLSEDELSGIKNQLLQGFLPDDAYPLGAPFFMDTPRPCSPLNHMVSDAFDEVVAPEAWTDEEAFPETDGSQSGRKTSLSINSLDILTVNQLLDSVLETARQVASFPVSSVPVPYDQVKNQCEALVTGKQQKMSVLQSFKLHQDSKAIVLSSDIEAKEPYTPSTAMELSEGNLKLINVEQYYRGQDPVLSCSRENAQQSFRLPPSSPFDKFMKAAGC